VPVEQQSASKDIFRYADLDLKRHITATNIFCVLHFKYNSW